MSVVCQPTDESTTLLVKPCNTYQFSWSRIKTTLPKWALGIWTTRINYDPNLYGLKLWIKKLAIKFAAITWKGPLNFKLKYHLVYRWKILLYPQIWLPRLLDVKVCESRAKTTTTIGLWCDANIGVTVLILASQPCKCSLHTVWVVNIHFKHRYLEV